MKVTLKVLPFFALIICLTTYSHAASAAHANLETSDVIKEVNVRSFLVGEDNEAGSLLYIVDRTAGLCFASLRISRAMGSGLGLTLVDCKRLTKIPSIAAFIKTGRAK